MRILNAANANPKTYVGERSHCNIKPHNHLMAEAPSICNLHNIVMIKND